MIVSEYQGAPIDAEAPAAASDRRAQKYRGLLQLSKFPVDVGGSCVERVKGIEPSS
jgi:hypothetical protein